MVPIEVASVRQFEKPMELLFSLLEVLNCVKASSKQPVLGEMKRQKE